MTFKKTIMDTSIFKRRKFVYKFFLLLCLPILIVVFFIHSSTAYYSNQYRDILTDVYSVDMNKFLQSAENEFSNLSNDVSLLLSIPAVSNLSYTNLTHAALNTDESRTAQLSLYSFVSRMKYAKNVIIANRSGGFVISAEGVFDFNDYFENICVYDNYSTDYWKNYRATSGSIRLLNPTDITDYSFSNKTFIPAVFPVIGSEGNSLFIFNIDAQKIYDEFNLYKFTDNTRLFMVNNTTGAIYTGSESAYADFSPDLSQSELLYNTIYYSISNLNINNEKYLLLSSQNRYGMFGFSYIGAIPYSDIEINTHRVLIRILLLAILFILLMLIYAYLGSLRLAKPWSTLADRLSNINDNTNSKNIISYVNDAVTSLIDKNSNLSHDLAISLSHGQQKYLIDILNNPNALCDDEMNKLIFHHEYFVSIAINISLKQSTAFDINVLNQQLYTEVYRAIESIFAASFDIFSLPSTNNTLYIILNTETDNCTDAIEDTIAQVKSLLSTDSEYINIFMGIGKIYNGIDGLRLSHQEALSEIFNDMNSDKIRIPDNNNLHEYTFGVSNENILINYILTGRAEDANEFIRNAFKSCAGSSAESRSRVYCGIYRAIDRVIKAKKIQTTDFVLKTTDEMLTDILLTSDETIMNYLLTLSDNIINIETPSNKIRIAEISDYIKAHFDEELYLDTLAQKFDIAPKYLSKVLKDHLGISFKTYLTQLRIDKAEELLTHDDIKINEICNAAGFVNHSAFIRAFKQKNGISPSEYRRLNKK